MPTLKVYCRRFKTGVADVVFDGDAESEAGKNWVEKVAAFRARTVRSMGPAAYQRWWCEVDGVRQETSESDKGGEG
jgi:hypothetical protein